MFKIKITKKKIRKVGYFVNLQRKNTYSEEIRSHLKFDIIL